jgi:serine/threonine-protein kinase
MSVPPKDDNLKQTASSGEVVTQAASTASHGPDHGDEPGPAAARRFDQATIVSKQPPLAAPGSDENSPFLGRNLEGQRLDHFELQEFVGGGGMGSVYRALDTRLGRIVAIKVLAHDHAMDSETIRRFHLEAQSAARLDHENVAQVYFVGEDQDLHYIAFEFIEGRNIRDLVEQFGPLPLEEAVSYTLQIAQAVAHASARDVVHRDIKPSNILITGDGRAKLVDMGLARIHQVEQSAQDLTASGVTLGTFDYISPEQARDPRNADVRSDIYSLGCTFYYMLIGQPPFPDGTVLQKLLQHQGDVPVDPRELNPDLPAEVSRIALKMLSKDPLKRYQKAGELIGDLLILAEELGVADAHRVRTVYVSRPVPHGQFVERHLPWAAPVVVLIVIVLALELISRFGTTSGPEGRELVGEPTGGPASFAPDPGDQSPPRPSLTAPGGDGSVPVDPPSSTIPPSMIPRPRNSEGDPPGASTDNGSSVASPKNPDRRVPTDHPVASDAPPLEVDPSSDAGLGPSSNSVAGSGDVLRMPASSSEVAPPSLSGAASASEPDLAILTAEHASQASQQALDNAGLLYVSQDTHLENHFGTLRAAVASAADGDVIVLRYDGYREELPFTIQNEHITVRAETGYAPVIQFRPGSTNPHGQSMIRVSGGGLTLNNVALDLELDGDVPPATAWTLIDSQHADLVLLRDCSLTIRNALTPREPLHRDVAFFNISLPPGREAGLGQNSDANPRAVRIELHNCVARGEAALVRSNEMQPLEFFWDNGLLSTTEQLLIAEGNAEQTPVATSSSMRLVLRHVTAEVRDGLCVLRDGPEGTAPLPAEIDCTNNIFRQGGSSLDEEEDESSALIRQHSQASISEVRKRIRVSEKHNFFDGFTLLWDVSGVNNERVSVKAISAPWRSFWAGDQQRDLGVRWQQTPDAQSPLHLYRPGDYVLDGEASHNPARRGASDGRNAGFDANLLPALPASPPPRSASTPRRLSQE